MSSRDVRLRSLFSVRPGGCLVVEGAGFQASAQDPDEPVRHPPQCVVLDAAGTEVVVERAGSGRGTQGIPAGAVLLWETRRETGLCLELG